MAQKVIQFSRCIYCGPTAGPMSEEHIVPKALGGTRTIRGVCKKCNNENLSEIDRALCSDSYLSVVASRYSESRVSDLWDVDHAADHLLLEGVFHPASNAMRLFPQMILDYRGGKNEWQMRGDANEIQALGLNEFQDRFIRHMLPVFRDHEVGKKRRLIIEKVDPVMIPPYYRFPPRIYIAHPLSDLKPKHKAVIRYRDDSDRRRILHAIANWNPEKQFKRMTSRIGTVSPPLRVEFNPHKVLRGLMKLALNILVQECEKTVVDRQSFGEAIAIIQGERPVTETILSNSGFVAPDALNAMQANPDSHLFWLIHHQGNWTIYSSFFGGNACTVVKFPGPNKENWSFRTVEVPLASNPNEWKRKDRMVMPALNPQVEWKDFSVIAPSIPLKNGVHFEFFKKVSRRAAS